MKQQLLLGSLRISFGKDQLMGLLEGFSSAGSALGVSRVRCQMPSAGSGGDGCGPGRAPGAQSSGGAALEQRPGSARARAHTPGPRGTAPCAGTERGCPGQGRAQGRAGQGTGQSRRPGLRHPALAVPAGHLARHPNAPARRTLPSTKMAAPASLTREAPASAISARLGHMMRGPYGRPMGTRRPRLAADTRSAVRSRGA